MSPRWIINETRFEQRSLSADRSFPGASLYLWHLLSVLPSSCTRLNTMGHKWMLIFPSFQTSFVLWSKQQYIAYPVCVLDICDQSNFYRRGCHIAGYEFWNVLLCAMSLTTISIENISRVLVGRRPVDHRMRRVQSCWWAVKFPMLYCCCLLCSELQVVIHRVESNSRSNVTFKIGFAKLSFFCVTEMSR